MLVILNLRFHFELLDLWRLLEVLGVGGTPGQSFQVQTCIMYLPHQRAKKASYIFADPPALHFCWISTLFTDDKTIIVVSNPISDHQMLNSWCNDYVSNIPKKQWFTGPSHFFFPALTYPETKALQQCCSETESNVLLTLGCIFTVIEHNTLCEKRVFSDEKFPKAPSFCNPESTFLAPFLVQEWFIFMNTLEYSWTMRQINTEARVISDSYGCCFPRLWISAALSNENWRFAEDIEHKYQSSENMKLKAEVIALYNRPETGLGTILKLFIPNQRKIWKLKSCLSKILPSIPASRNHFKLLKAF